VNGQISARTGPPRRAGFARVGAGVGRKDLAFAFVKKSKLYHYFLLLTCAIYFVFHLALLKVVTALAKTFPFIVTDRS
jgi:hypothetical protein